MKKLIVFAAANLMACIVSAITVDVQVFRHSFCGRQSGYAIALVSGGVPPYTYSWSNGSTTGEAEGLFPGNYSLTATDAVLAQATANFTIDLLSSYNGGGASSVYTMGYCPGEAPWAAIFTGMPDAFTQPPPEGQYGPNPYTFSHPLLSDNAQTSACLNSNDFIHHLLQFDGAAPGYYLVDFMDASGCPGQVQVVLPAAWSTFPQVQVLNVDPSCASTATGSVTYSAQGSTGYDYKVILRPEASGGPCEVLLDEHWQGAYSGGSTRTATNLLPGNYWLITTNDVMNLLENNQFVPDACKDSLLVTVPSLGIDCGVISGRVYIDDDASCTMAGAENRVPGTIVEITPGPIYLTTSSTGQYSIGLNFGSYTVSELNPTFVQSCPGGVTLSSGAQTMNVGCFGGEPLDVQLSMANGPARPGFELGYAIDLDNLTPASAGVVTLTVMIDPTLGFISAFPAPNSIAGNVLTWTSPQLVMNQVFQHRDINVRTQVPPDVGLIGSTLTTTAQLLTANTDGNLANNAATSNQLVTGSFDPNDKTAVTSSGLSSTEYYLVQDEWIDYTIRFQNTGTDTVFNVVITDTLPATFDPASIAWGAGSHTHTRSLEGAGVLKFIFPNILLPDSAANEPLSHGFVSFRIRPNLPITPGTVIENAANIYFDFNPPVITEPSVLVAEFNTGVVEQVPSNLSLSPVPVNEQLSVSCSSAIERIVILAADGRVVQQMSVLGSRACLDVNGLTSGVYLLIAGLSNGTTARERFIKD